MGQEFTVTGLPEDGERHLTTGDLRAWLARLDALGDDGSAVVHARPAWFSARVTQIRAAFTAPEPVHTAWGEMLDEARAGLRELPAAPTDDASDGDTITGLPVVKTGTARLNRRQHGSHARQ
jgi:hypothetical protein